jgi:RNase P/RNase MRP subunit p29
VTQGNPHWQRAQPKAQTKQQQEGRQRRGVRDDFGDEWLGKDVEVEQVKGQGVVAIRGRVVDVSKYWLKIIVNGEVVYLNKAYIVSIKPAEMKDTASGGGNGGEQRPKSK